MNQCPNKYNDGNTTKHCIKDKDHEGDCRFLN